MFHKEIRLFILNLAMLLASVTLLAEGELFQPLKFEDALAKAKTEEKMVFVDFFTTWCGPCKMLDRSTWKDERVVKWLRTHTIPLKIDAEVHTGLSKEYDINGYPSLLFFNYNGEVLDRLVGYRDANTFIKEAENLLHGKDSLARAREALELAGHSNPQARMDYARELINRKEYEAALKELAWCFDEGHKADLAFIGVRNSFLLYMIAQLGRNYPPAMEMLVSRRDALELEVAKGQAMPGSYADYANINQYLGESDKTLALYERSDADGKKALARNVFGDLLKQRRYEEIGNSMDLFGNIDLAFVTFKQLQDRDGQAFKDYDEQMRAEIIKSQLRSTVSKASDYYQTLIGLGQLEQAENLAKRILALDESADTYNGLAWAGYLTGKPVAANLEQARKAHELSKGQSAAILDTLARIMAKQGQASEAIALVEGKREAFNRPLDLKLLDELSAELKARKD